MHWIIVVLLLAILPYTAAARETATASKAQGNSAGSKKAGAAKKTATSQRQKRPSKRRPARSSKATAKPRPRVTPADSAGIKEARPGSLKAMAIAVLEKNSIAQKRALEAFAKRHSTDVNGALARLVLGYHAYRNKRYSEAKTNFDAALTIPSRIQDYAEYYLALSEVAEGNHPAAAKLLNGFASRYPASSLAGTATLRQAESLLASDRASEATSLLTSSAVALPQPGTDFLLGQAYGKNGQPLQAAQLLQKVYYFSPTSLQASGADNHLRELRSELGQSYPSPSAAMRAERADRLFAAGRCNDAESEYRAVASFAAGPTRDRARVRVGVCRFRSGEARAALATLRDAQVTDPEADAERIYNIAAIYRRLEQPDVMEQQVELLGRTYPQSSWYEKALFMTGNQYLVSHDRSRAAQFYSRVYRQFPQGELAGESHWRVAWTRYRERNVPEARRLFEEHIRNYPASPQVPAAIYWTGRTLERESPAAAALYYRKLVDTFPNYYYAHVARARLAKLGLGSTADGVNNAPIAPAALLEPIRRPAPIAALDGSNLRDGLKERRERAKLLESAWLIDLAIEELKGGLANDIASNFFLGRELAHLEEARGRYHVALNYAKRLLNGYFAFEMDELPRDDWELLFPRPWWAPITRKAEALDLDPYLVAGLIRQESEFNPSARSPSNAYGLMQLLPSTATRMARKMSGRRTRFRLASLNQPETNVAYGTFYLRQVLDQFNGSVEQALAAYNAGENRVVEWLEAGSYDEPAEFVESIPFTETREYVQAVMRNAALYRKLYTDSGEHRVASDGSGTAPATLKKTVVTSTSATPETGQDGAR